jgi:hypothetical protein
MTIPNQLANLPPELVALDNWVSWRLVERDGKFTKPLFVAGTNRYASSIDPSTWRSFETVASNTTAINSEQGVGFVIGGKAVQEKVVGIDLDGCRDAKTQKYTQWAIDLFGLTQSYSEITPSGAGARIWVKGTWPTSEHVFDLDPAAGFGDKVKVEVYSEGRYFTCTGDSVYQESVGIKTCDLAKVYELVREIQKKYPPASKVESGAGDTAGASSSVQIKNDGGPVSTNKYVLLTQGDISGDKPCRIRDDHGNYMDYPDRSAADLGLCNACAMKHGNNPDAIWEDYKASSLYREKEWGKREADFRRLTIARAIAFAEKIKAEAAAKMNVTGEPGDSLIWAEPHPFEPLLLPVPPFKIEYLPAAFRPWALDVAERMSIPLDYVGICMLCSFSAVIGRRAFVQPKEFDTSWTEALNLLGAVVAPSGGMKTPTWKIFTNEVTAIEIEWKKQYQAAMDAYNQELAKYLAFNKGKAKKNYEGVEPIPPETRRRLVINDATPESAHTLMEKHPEGLLLYRDEIGGWLSDLDKPGRESAREMFLVAANGNDSHTQDRIGRGEVSAIMCLIFFGGMQPKIAQDLVNDERNAADGTIARLGLLSYPNKVPPSKPLDRPVNEAARERFRSALRAIAHLHQRDIYLKFSPAAQPVFNSWLEDHVQREHLLSGPICSHFSKYKGLLPRLAAIYHLADAASALSAKYEAVKNDDVIVGSEISVAGFQTIADEHLARAIAFLGDYLEPHMRRLYGCVKSPIQRREATLAEHILAGDLKDGFTVRDVTRKGWAGLTDIGDVHYTLETFCEMNWIRPIPRPAGQDGRPTNKYEINPALKSVLTKETQELGTFRENKN